MAEAEMNHETPSTLTRNSAVTFAHARPVVSAQPSVSNDYETSGNLALKPDTNVITFPSRIEPAKPEPALFKELKKSKKAKPKTKRQSDKAKAKRKTKGKQPTFKETTGSLSNELFPEVLPDETGRFAIESQGAGFVVRFRDDVPLVEGSIKKSHYFFRVSRKLYNTWKGLSKDEQRTQIAKHVRGHLRDAIERGNAEARSIARKLRV